MVRLQAWNYLLLDGEILANGGDANVVLTSGGSGGSVWISGATVTGKGILCTSRDVTIGRTLGLGHILAYCT